MPNRKKLMLTNNFFLLDGGSLHRSRDGHVATGHFVILDGTGSSCIYVTNPEIRSIFLDGTVLEMHAIRGYLPGHIMVSQNSDPDEHPPWAVGFTKVIRDAERKHQESRYMYKVRPLATQPEPDRYLAFSVALGRARVLLPTPIMDWVGRNHLALSVELDTDRLRDGYIVTAGIITDGPNLVAVVMPLCPSTPNPKRSV